MKKISIAGLASLSLVFNLTFGGYNLVTGLAFRSWWFITLASYYIVLSIMRAGLLRIRRKNINDLSTEHFAKRFTGAMLIVLSLCLVGTVILATVTERGIKQNEITMITLALYAFTKITMAIINLAKSKSLISPAEKAIRSISFADALVSIFSLQRSMLVSFGEMAVADIRLFNSLTGGGVSLMVFLLGINLIGGKKSSMAKSAIIKSGKKIANGIVGGYKAIEKGVVSGYTKIEDKFVDLYLTKDGETVEEAKNRLKKQ